MQMQDDWKICDYFSKLIAVVNQMKTCGETIIDYKMVEKVMKSLPSIFYFILVIIQESKDLETLKNRGIWELFEGPWTHGDW